ncbi:hypothetical protein GcC1_199053 [Golovinomyces cichoracearum]|uniref:Uncharacterized protein n=1 Tax=Golovinomyces cichoracearum TaxID=62708 RepID=A0A420HF67_9PEZI|nr:hypothetical protein GcC1_199053 [Golovinomyces cichoracearum]
MDSPSIKRIENGQSPDWTSEELHQIQEQKRQQKQIQKNVSRKTSPFNFKKVVGKEEHGNFDPLEDVSYDANQQIQDEEKRQDEIRRLRSIICLSLDRQKNASLYCEQQC